MNISPKLAKRFRGFLPVVVDIETGGFNAITDAVLEVAAFPILLDENENWVIAEHMHYHVKPFEGAKLDPEALKFNKIDPHHPFRLAVTEKQMFEDMNPKLAKLCKEANCQRAVLVGHNAWFDLSFMNAAIARTKAKSVFHRFTSFDTATLGALFYGQTVLSKVLHAAKIDYSHNDAHSALYDAKQTAELFCEMLRNWDNK